MGMSRYKVCADNHLGTYDAETPLLAAWEHCQKFGAPKDFMLVVCGEQSWEIEAEPNPVLGGWDLREVNRV